MLIDLHSQATTPKVRAEIQASDEPAWVLAERYGTTEQTVLKDVCELNTHGFAIDEQLNMNFVRDLAKEHGKGFGGNLKLTLALSLGLLSPREDAIVSLSAGGHVGYTFAPG